MLAIENLRARIVCETTPPIPVVEYDVYMSDAASISFFTSTPVDRGAAHRESFNDRLARDAANTIRRLGSSFEQRLYQTIEQHHTGLSSIQDRKQRATPR